MTAEERKEELLQCLATSVALVKTVCGVGNNAAWMACLEARDMAKKHPNYAKKGKGGQSAKSDFKAIIKAHDAYEKRLIYGGPVYFFRLQDLRPELRKAFGNISDREYYEFWCAIGETAYSDTRPFVTCLANKFRLALAKHGEAEPECAAWLLTAWCCLRIACDIFDGALKNVAKQFNVVEKRLRKEFMPFSLHDLYKQWEAAMYALHPNLSSQLDDVEERNIALGIADLTKRWMDTGTLYGSAVDTFAEYDEVWRTPGEQQKAIRGLCEEMEEVQKAEAEDKQKHNLT